jgi:hypothetical protein
VRAEFEDIVPVGLAYNNNTVRKNGIYRKLSTAGAAKVANLSFSIRARRKPSVNTMEDWPLC